MTSILRHNRLALLGGGVLLLMVAISVAASWIASTDPAMMQPRMRLTPPGEAFLLGTDALGRDVYSRVVHGSRMSLAIGALVVLITIAIGTLIGLVAGASRIMDRVLMRIMDGVMAIPGILLAVALVSLFGASLASVVIAIAVPEFRAWCAWCAAWCSRCAKSPTSRPRSGSGCRIPRSSGGTSCPIASCR